MASLHGATAILFRSPSDVYEAFVARAVHLGWPYTKEQLNALREQRPKRFISRSNRVLVLDIWLGDLKTTFDALVAWNVDVHPAVEVNYLQTDHAHLRLVRPDRYGATPSIRWVVVDLTAGRDRENGAAAIHARDSDDAAGLQVLGAAAQHPLWPPAMAADAPIEVPWARLPGIIATDYGVEHVPVLNWIKVHGLLQIGMLGADVAHYGYALPTYRDLDM